MPAVSQKQRGLIFSKRNKYGSKSDTPKKWKWIWEEGWENKGKLPKKKKKKNESNVITFSNFLNEATLTLTKHEKIDVPEEDILDIIKSVKSWFEKNPDRESCIAGIFGYASWNIYRESIEKDIRDCANVARPYKKANEEVQVKELSKCNDCGYVGDTFMEFSRPFKKNNKCPKCRSIDIEDDYFPPKPKLRPMPLRVK